MVYVYCLKHEIWIDLSDVCLNLESVEAERLHLCSGTQRAHDRRLLGHDLAESVPHHCDADQSVWLHSSDVRAVLALRSPLSRSLRPLRSDARRRGKDRRLCDTHFESQIQTKCKNRFTRRHRGSEGYVQSVIPFDRLAAKPWTQFSVLFLTLTQKKYSFLGVLSVKKILESQLWVRFRRIPTAISIALSQLVGQFVSLFRLYSPIS